MNMKTKLIVFLGVFVPLSGCGLIYTDVRVPRAYRSATPADVLASPDDPVVTGKTCNQSLLFLFAWGKAGYADATRKALTDHPDGILYYVKSDMQALSVLGLYTRTCTILTGKVGRVK